MRKLLRALAVLGTAALLSRAPDAHAGLGQVVKCPRRTKPVTIDGKLDEWAAWPKTTIDAQTAGPIKPRSAEDLTYHVFVAWDARHLYVAADVTDDRLECPTMGTEMWRCDSLCLCLDGRYDTETTYQGDDYQLVFAPSGPGGAPQARLYRNPALREGPPRFVEFAATTRKGGYAIEVAIPWKHLHGGVPTAGQAVGFSHSVHDNDGDPDARRFIAWADDDDPSAHPLCWGHLILVETAEDDISAKVEAIEAARARLERLARGEAAELDNQVTLRVVHEPVGQLDLGIGWNTGYFWGSIPTYTEEEWRAYLDLFSWTNPHWVRYALHFWHWEPRNDDHDPDRFDWDGFAFDSPWMRLHYRFLDHCERHGIPVLLNNRNCGQGGSGWMAETVRDPRLQDIDDTWWNDAPYDDREFVETLAALLHHLKVVRKYRCVRQISIWNEPDGLWSYNSPNALYPFTFFPLYPLLSEKLTATGLRDQVQIVGPDTSGPYGDKAAIPGLLRFVRDSVDVAAEHDYTAWLDWGVGYPPLSEAVPVYAKLVKDLEAAYGRRVPFGLTELGNSGNGAGKVDDDQQVWLGMLATTQLILRTMPVGVGGFLRWEFRPYGDTGRNFGALTTTGRRTLFAPYGPVYFGHSLLSRYCDRGSAVLETELTGGRDENGVARVHAAALLLPDGHLAVFLVNDGLVAKQVTVALDAATLAGARFHHLYYDATLPPTIQLGEAIPVQDGKLAATLTPRSITTLTTRPDGTSRGELEAPLRLSPPRHEPTIEVIDRPGGRRVERHRWGFERPISWGLWRSSKGNSGVHLGSARRKSGRSSLAIRYQFVAAEALDGAERFFATTPADLVGKPLRLSAWVHGDGRGMRLGFVFVDATGETFYTRPVATLDWQGWQEVAVDTSAIPQGFAHWGEGGDGVVDQPIRQVGIGFEEPGDAFVGSGIIYLDDLEILTALPKPEPAKAPGGDAAPPAE